MKQTTLLSTFFFLILNNISLSQNLVLDIEKSNGSGNPRNLTFVNNKLFFVANENNDAHLFSLNLTDRTILNLSKSSFFYEPNFDYNSQFSSLNNILVFNGDSFASGNELWISDGTINGTKLLKDLNPGNADSWPSGFTEINGKILFWAENSTYGRELWSSDGTNHGTEIVKDIIPGSFGISSHTPNHSITTSNGLYYFTFYTTSFGEELWVSDGTNSGTFLIKDIYIGSNSSSISNLYEFQGKVCFNANNGIDGEELWVTDGTAIGTYQIKNINPFGGSSPRNFQSLGDKLLFGAYEPNTGFELYVTDGTTGGTNLIKDITPGSSSYLGSLTKFNDIVLFQAGDGVNGVELWKSDGTNSGTNMIKDINTNSSGIDNLSFPRILEKWRITATSNKAYFTASDGTNGFELWVTDGTENNTQLVQDFNPGSLSSKTAFEIASSNEFVFVNIFENGEGETWSIKDSNPIPQKVNSIGLNSMLKSIYPMGVQNNYFYLVAYHENSGFELYKYDGASISQITDFQTNNFSFQSKPLTFINNRVVFSYGSELYGNELWSIDNSNLNTSLIVDFNKFPNIEMDYSRTFYPPNYTTNFYSNSTSLFRSSTFQNHLYLTNFSQSIYRTDGLNFEKWLDYGINARVSLTQSTENGLFWFEDRDCKFYHFDGTDTNVILDKGPFCSGQDPFVLGENDQYTFFSNCNNSEGCELWRTDGTAIGTHLVKDINPGSSSTRFIGDIPKINNKFIFQATTSQNGLELWTSDGTEIGTQMLFDINPGSSSSYISQFVKLNSNKLLFVTENLTLGRELWITDGTTNGTKNVAEILPGNGYSNIFNLTVLGSFCYFSGYNGSSYNLYKTDGLTIEIIKPNFNVNEMIVFDNKLIFRALMPNSTTDRELWISDGTVEGTKILANINKYGSSSPSNFFIADNNLFFYADDGIHGSEMYFISKCYKGLTNIKEIDGSFQFKSSSFIEGSSQNIISENSNIEYSAQKFVELKNGFETKNGAVFKVNIKGCLD